LSEVEEKWSINDLFDAHEILDTIEEMEERELAKLKRK
jgi:hypothetical protein